MRPFKFGAGPPMLQVTPVRAFVDNYIWLVHAPRDERQVVIVDPGDAEPVRQALKQQDLTPAAIFATHHHADHVGGVAELADQFAVPVYGPANETMPVAVKRLSEGDRVVLEALDLQFEVLDVPGHTAGHIALFGHGALFCGDTLFSAGCGRLFEGTAKQMHESLAKLKSLPADMLMYCGHEYTVANLQFALAVEPDNADAYRHLEHCQAQRARHKPTLPSTIGLERKINPFLRCEFETVKRAAEQRIAHAIDSETAIFATLRDWKNQFKA